MNKDESEEVGKKIEFEISMRKESLDRFRDQFTDEQLKEMLGDMISDAILKPKEEDHFKWDFLSTTAALAIIKEYGRVIDRRGSVILKRLDCDLFQAAARHTGAIKHMTRYYGASGRHMVHIPSLVKSGHGMIRWDWDWQGECQICPEKCLCYDEREEADDG